jgi:peptidoglycan hydrolase-like protein with peptidoglycan-binding domain
MSGAMGAKVARLHEQLRQNNFEVPAQEVRREFFGPLTREAILAYQREHGLGCSGEVDESTTALLSGNPQPRAGGIARAGATGARGVTRTSTLVPNAGPTRHEPSLYARLGGVFAIAAVIDHFSDAVVQNPIVGQKSENPALREWHLSGREKCWGSEHYDPTLT